MRYNSIALTGEEEGQGPHLPTETQPPAVMTEEEFLGFVEPIRLDMVRHVETQCAVKADAEDAVQNAIVYCLQHRDQYNPEEASLKTWVTRKALWCALDINDEYERRRQFEEEYPDFDDTDNAGRPAELRQVLNAETRKPDWPKRARMRERPTPEQSDDTDLGRSYQPTDDIRLDLQKALQCLRPEVGNAVSAVLMEGFTEREYAEKAGVSKSTVNRLVQEGKRELRRLLS